MPRRLLRRGFFWGEHMRGKKFWARSLSALALAAVLLPAAGAEAVDFRAKGQWIMSFDYGSGSQFANYQRDEETRTHISGWGGRGQPSSTDNFSAQQRLRMQLDAVASESLSGTVFFEIGEQGWGRATQGAALGADGVVVRVKNAYLDWMVPNVDVKVRMGIQNMALPAFSTGASQIWEDDAAGIAASWVINEKVALSAFWARLYNDNYISPTGVGNGYLDNADMFGLLLPMRFDGMNITPWVMAGTLGSNTFRSSALRESDEFFDNLNAVNAQGVSVITGLYPAVIGLRGPDDDTIKKYNNHRMTPFWVGLTGEVTAWDPWRLAFDLNYGNTSTDYTELARAGWYASLLAEYKLDWGIPGIYAWYSSGDDGDFKNGSERMPTLRANGQNGFSSFAGTGNPYIARGGLLGLDLIGTWGVGVRLRDMSFLDGLTHTLRINYFNGTNSPAMARFITGKEEPANMETEHLYSDFNKISAIFDPFTAGNSRYDLYLTSRDHALEFDVTTSWKLYENLTLFMQAAYIALWLDNSKSMWGPAQAGAYPGGEAVRGFGATDAWNVNMSLVYEF